MYVRHCLVEVLHEPMCEEFDTMLESIIAKIQKLWSGLRRTCVIKTYVAT